MAALRYKDEHNKVGYLFKPTGSDDYHQIIDFLRASHIRMDNLGYVTKGKLTFFKNKFSPQWRFLVHTILHCLSTKSGSWDQFGSPIVVALICLSDGRHFNWSSYIFKGMGKPMPLLPAMLLQAQVGEGAKVAAQAIPQHMPAPDQPQDHLSTPPRQQPSDPPALVPEHGQSSDANTASFSRSHETAAGPFTNVENKPLGGFFHMSPPRSTQAPPAGQPSGGAEDPITLTALSSVVSTLVQKIHSLETELNDHKKLFKDVVGKLVKKVKAMEVKLKTKKRKMVVSDFDQEEGGKQDVDLDALRALANAVVTIDSNISPGGASHNPAASTSVPAAVLTGTSAVPLGASTVPPSSPSVPADIPSSVAPAGVSSKGKSSMVEEDIPVKARTFKQMKEDRLGKEAAKRLHDEEQAQMDRQRAEVQRRRRMAALIKRKRQALAEKLAQERQNRPMTQAQQRAIRQYIRKVQSNSQIQAFSRTLKRTGPVFEEPSSKRQKSTEAPIPSMPEVPQSSAVSLLPSSGTRKKSLGRKRLTKPKSTLQELDLDADAQTFIKVVSTKDSDDEAPPVWSALVGWEVLFDSHKGGKGSCVWQHQDLLEIRSWRLYTLSNVYVLETVFGEVFYMFADVSYPLLVKLMQRMLMHKLEIDSDVMGNDMTNVEQLIQFIKNQLVAAQVSSV
nr:ribonuclease H-like domain-containing protein [Tanacetum cinerariifolium]